MTTFLDGPAKGQNLALKRAVRFLRVTEENGKFDALDLPTDRPRPEEKLYAYEIFGAPGWAHINRGRHGSGFYAIAEYRFIEDQPSDAEMRDFSSWMTWCERRAK